MIKYEEKYGKFKQALVYTNKGECLSCRTKGVAEYIESLEKALDKACEELDDMQMSFCGIDEELHGIYPNFKNAEEWKEWCLEEYVEFNEAGNK